MQYRELNQLDQTELSKIIAEMVIQVLKIERDQKRIKEELQDIDKTLEQIKCLMKIS